MADRHRWGQRSLDHLATVHPLLRHLCTEALKLTPFDLTVTCGRRGRDEQEDAVKAGTSKLHWPRGKHNTLEPNDPAWAVDIHPYPVDFLDLPRYCFMAGVILTLAREQQLVVRWGGDWDGDGVLIKDQSLVDLPHFELSMLRKALWKPGVRPE